MRSACSEIVLTGSCCALRLLPADLGRRARLRAIEGDVILAARFGDDVRRGMTSPSLRDRLRERASWLVPHGPRHNSARYRLAGDASV